MEKKTGLILIFLLIVTAFQVSAYEFCEDGVIGEKNLRLISVDDMLKDNFKEWEWQPLENIEIEIRVENKDDEAKDYMVEIIFIDENENKVRVAKNNDDLEKSFSLSANQRESISLEFEIDEDIEKDEYDMYVKFYKDSDEDTECVENSEETITIERIEICEDGNVNKNDLEIIKITDSKRNNDNEWEWAPGSNFGVVVELENKDYSERTFIVELIMLDEDNEEIEFARDDSDVEEDIKLEEDQNGEVEFVFSLRPGVEEGEYSLYARFYDESDSNICTSLKAEDSSNPSAINVKLAERKVIVSKVEGPNNAETFSTINFTATITNTGGENEEKVSVLMYNRLLDIKETIEIDDLESGEEETVVFELEIPEDAPLSMHKISFSTEYEYDEKVDFFRSSSDEDDDKKVPLMLTEGEEIIEEVVENITENIQNGTIIETEIENEAEIPTTAITGNAIGESSKPLNWAAILGLIALAAVGIFLFFKKPSPKKDSPIVTPNITRRYTARLD